MADKSVLSQDEIDALLHGVEEGNVPAGSGRFQPDGEVVPFDFKDQEHLSRNQFPQLELINQRFLRDFDASLYHMFKRTLAVEVEPVRLLKYGEFIDSIESPAAINLIQIQPLNGTALLVMDRLLVFLAVDSYFGGGGRIQQEPEKSEFTLTEERIIQMLREAVFLDLERAWEPVSRLHFEHLKSEVNPRFTNILTASEVVVVSRFRIRFSGGEGTMQLVLPLTMLEPVREQLENGLVDNGSVDDRQWLACLRREILEAEVELSSVLVEVPISLRQVLDMAPGDLIPAELPEKIVVRAAGIPVLRGEFGVVKGKNGVKIDAPVSPSHFESMGTERKS